MPPFSLKKGANSPFLREKGVPNKNMIQKCTDPDFLWYQYGKYQEIPTDTDQKIPIRYTTLVEKEMERWVGSMGGVVVEDEHAVLW